MAVVVCHDPVLLRRGTLSMIVAISTGVPQARQNLASLSSLAPHLWQYDIT
jgi:hypothetical protein